MFLAFAQPPHAAEVPQSARMPPSQPRPPPLVQSRPTPASAPSRQSLQLRRYHRCRRGLPGSGPLNPFTPGEQNGGRREVNWDAVPAGNTNTFTFPGDFFNQNVAPRARGVVFSTDGSGLSVSNNDFSFINLAYGDEFNAFSPVRTFSAIGSNTSRVDFFVAGSTTPARSTGFGVVFSDVDQLGSASITLIGANGESLGVYQAPACGGGFSFVGVKFATPLVAAVEIKSGQGPLGDDAADVSDRDHGPARDLVVMDDFIYGEPRSGK